MTATAEMRQLCRGVKSVLEGTDFFCVGLRKCMVRQVYLVFYLFKGSSDFFKNFSFKLAFDKAEIFLTVVTVFCGRRIFIKQTHRVNSKNLRKPLDCFR